MINSVLKIISGIVKLRGGTDNTVIGNSSDRLKTDTTGTVTANVGTTNGLALDSSVNTLLKPASTLSAVTTLGSITNALPTGTNSIGQVTANAGTNLNTSALALESTQSTQNTRIGDLTETAPASDTASSGLNGRLQRLAQRLTSLINLFPTSIGQKNAAGSLSVVFASDVSVGTSALANDGSLWSASAEINATLAGADNPILLLRNPSGSGKSLYIWRGRLGCLVTNNSMSFKIFSNPIITMNGTTLSATNRNIGGTNPTSIALCSTIPTISISGSLIGIASVGQNTNSIDLNEDFAIKINPGNSILLTCNPSSNNRAAAVTFTWQERA